jgi:replicative superfamily II helicase
MPKVIREKIEDLFRRKVIKLIFTTSTLLEGVNIQAKNIILTSDNNGLSDLTEEDFLNLIGRAGRFRSELYGNVICLKGAFENSQRYKYFSSQNVSNLNSEILSSIRGNFYKDIKQIIQGKQPVTKKLEEDHKKHLIREQYANIAILHNKINYNSKLKTNLIRATSDPSVFKQIDKDISSVDKLESFKEYTTIPIKYQQKVFATQDPQIIQRFIDFDANLLTYGDIAFLTEKIMKTYEFYKRGLVKYERSYAFSTGKYESCKKTKYQFYKSRNSADCRNPIKRPS